MISARLAYEPRVDLPAHVVTWLEQGTPILVTRWRYVYPGEADEAQCGSVGGTQFSAFGEWTAPIRMDTDNRSGGCNLQWAIIDPANKLTGLNVTAGWRFSINDDPNVNGYYQCKGNHGDRTIPITTSIPQDENQLSFSDYIGVDTDNEQGACDLTFSLAGRSDVALDVAFWGDDDVSQCSPPDATIDKPKEVYQGTPAAALRIDTDRRWGGCVQRLRLRAR
jgi:hypothetical protein